MGGLYAVLYGILSCPVFNGGYCNATEVVIHKYPGSTPVAPVEGRKWIYVLSVQFFVFIYLMHM